MSSAWQSTLEADRAFLILAARLRAWPAVHLKDRSQIVARRIRSEVVVPWMLDLRLAVRRGMTGATGNLYCGLHEIFDMMLLLHFLRANDPFLDIGSNIGSYAILASGGCGASTWAFEPDPVASLKRNVELNSLQHLITVQGIALGSSDCTVPFTVGQDTVNRVAKDMKKR
jgi:hypothetical protein